jgi:hypothetical protein
VNNVPAGRWNAPSGGAQTCHSWAPGGREEQQPISFSAFANQGGGTCQHHPSGPCRTLTFRLPHTHTDHAAPPPLTKPLWIHGIFTFCLLLMTRQIPKSVDRGERRAAEPFRKGGPLTAHNIDQEFKRGVENTMSTGEEADDRLEAAEQRVCHESGQHSPPP